MVLLSFSVFENELKARTKGQTVRPYTPTRFRQLSDAELLQCWWKSRTPDGYKLYDAILTEPPFVIEFTCSHAGPGNAVSFLVKKCTDINIVHQNFLLMQSVVGPVESLRQDEMRDLATRDGFQDLTMMMFHFISEHGTEKVFRDPWIVTRFKAL
jgi:hypothetical protein